MTERKVSADNLLNEIINSDLAALAEMLELKCPINVVGKCGEAPMHIAIYKRDSRMLHMLMKSGADIMFQNSNGDTALHVASRMGLSDVVRLLYNEYSTDLQRKRLFLQAKNKEGLTALDIACMPVLKTELDLTRKYCSWDSETGFSLDDEQGPLQRGRQQCAAFLQDKIKTDVLAKEEGSVLEMVAQNDGFQRTAGILRGNFYASSASRVFQSELDYPARLDSNAWNEDDKQFFLDYEPGVRKVVTKLHATDFATKTIRSGFNSAQLLQRRGEVNAFIAQEARPSRNRKEYQDPTSANSQAGASPAPAHIGGADKIVEKAAVGNELSMRDRLRMLQGRKMFLEESSGEPMMPSMYYNPGGVPKTVAELQTVALNEMGAGMEKTRIDLERARKAIPRIRTALLACEGKGAGRVEEGLFSVHNSHGQPEHHIGNLTAIDARFSEVRPIPADDRQSAHINVLQLVETHADDAVDRAYAASVMRHAGRNEELEKTKQEYNSHMTFAYSRKLL